MKHLYNASAREVGQVDVPTLQFLMTDGKGDPNKAAFVTGDKSQWHWTLMIMQPAFVPADVVHAAMTEVKRKGKYGLRGKPHEIYLSDIRRANPAKWKTIIRQPMISVDMSDQLPR